MKMENVIGVSYGGDATKGRVQSEYMECKDISSDDYHEYIANPVTSNEDKQSDGRKSRPVRSKTLEMTYECDECGSTFTRSSLLVAHKMKHSEGPPLTCIECNKKFENKDEWMNHTETGCNSDNCTSLLNRKQNYIRSGQRRRIRGGGKRFKCSQCAKLFRSLGSKKEHERNVHNPIHKYDCSECGKSFYKKYNLNIHKEIHNENRSHMCSICGKSFKTSQGIRMHMESHSDKRPFMCEVCGKVFKTRAVLDSHSALHTRETRYSCNLCGKAYRYRASLFIHMRTHTGYRPYGCTECDATFIVKSHLTEHMRTHTGEHPFVCRFCSASFTRAVSLKKHLNSHIKAGCNVNLHSAMYQAKVQAFVKPRDSYKSISEPDFYSSIPKVTHFIQDNIFVKDSRAVSVDNASIERVELYVDQPMDEKELIVIKVSCIDEAGTCAYDIVQTSPDDDQKSSNTKVKPMQPSYKIKEKRLKNTDDLNRRTIQVKANLKKSNAAKETKEKPTPFNCVKGNDESLKPHIQSILSLDDDNRSNSLKGKSGIDWMNSQGVIVDKIIQMDLECNATEYDDCQSQSEIENKKVIVSEILAGEKSETQAMASENLSSTNGHYSNIFRVYEEADDKNNGISKQCIIEDSSIHMEHQEVLLQKCYSCEKVFKCQVFIEGEDMCQECKSQQFLHTIDDSKVNNSQTSEKCSPVYTDNIDTNLLNKDKNPFNCEQCNASFPFRSELRKHAKQHSTKYPHMCDKCGQSFQQEIFLLKHHCSASNSDIYQQPKTPMRQKVESSSEYKCDECGKVFSKKFILKVHYRKHTGVNPFKCKKCPKRFISVSHRKVHMRFHTGKIPYKCQNCSKYFPKRSKLLHHMCENQENPSKEVSQVLNIPIKEEPVDKSLQKKMDRNTISLVKDIKVEVASQDSTVKQEMILGEVLQETPHSSSLKCKFCGRKFKFLSVLQAHERSHTGEKPFLCSVCNKAFSKKSNMEVHMRTHTGERPFLCDFCGKYFAYKYSLDAHKRIHTQERPFQCNICGKSFRQEASRHVHMKRHLGERAFKCDSCPKAFVAKIDLDSHRRIHTGEKPYQCEECNRSFRIRHHLTEHRRCHTGEKPFACEYCNMTFARAGTRKAHMKKHLSDMS